MTSKVETAVCEAFRVILDLPPDPGQNVLRKESPIWDSLKHMEIIFAVEARLGIQFSEEEMGAIDSKDHIVRLAVAHLES